MSDIAPKPIAAPAGVAPTMAATATAASSATATAAEIPAAVANLSVGSLVTGTVVERGARGLVLLRTDKGTIKFQSTVPLKPGSTVTLQIQSVGAQVQLSILSIDGNPLAAPQRAAPAPVRPDSLGKPLPADGSSAARAASAQQASHPAATTAGETARGTPNASARAAPASGFVARPLIGPTVSAGLEALSVSSSADPAAAASTATPRATVPLAAPAGAAAPGATAPGNTPSALAAGDKVLASFIGMQAAATPDARGPTVATTATPGGGVQAMPAAEPVMLRLVGVEPAGATATPSAALRATATTPASTSPPAAATAAGFGSVQSADAPPASTATSPATLLGTILDSPGGATNTLIRTPLGILVLPGAAPGPPGTRLLLEIVPRADVPAAAVHRPELTQSAPGANGPRGEDWPLLREIMTAARSADPALAERLMNTILPRVGPNLAAGLLAFVAALRQGNPRAWLGEQTVDALQRGGHGALIDRLGDEFAAMNRAAGDVGPSGWQSLLVPLFDGERIQQIRMYMKRTRRKAGERGGTRFMIEAELTKLGSVQLDGLISKPQFDLVVRTRAALPPAMRGDIIEIFGDALLATKLTGAVMFQVVADLRAGPPETEGEAGIGLIV